MALRNNKPKIILIGKARAGKSTLANMLVSETLKGNGKDKFLYSNNARGVTKECHVEEGARYKVVDTIGLCEGTNATVDHETAKFEVFDRIKRENLGSNDRIIFVTRNTRPDQTEIGLWREFQETFPEHMTKTIIVQTRNINGLTNEQKIGFLSSLRAKFSTPVVCVNFPAPDGKNVSPVDEKDRNVSLDRIYTALNNLSWSDHSRQASVYNTKDSEYNKHVSLPMPAIQPNNKNYGVKKYYYILGLIACLAFIGMIVASVIAAKRANNTKITSIEFPNGLNLPKGFNVSDPFIINITD